MGRNKVEWLHAKMLLDAVERDVFLKPFGGALRSKGLQQELGRREGDVTYQPHICSGLCAWYLLDLLWDLYDMPRVQRLASDLSAPITGNKQPLQALVKSAQEFEFTTRCADGRTSENMERGVLHFVV